LGYVEEFPNPAGLKMPLKTPKLQIVTIQNILDGARMTLPLAEAVVKSAERQRIKGKNRRMGFDSDEE
jgi:hypothetical protein